MRRFEFDEGGSKKFWEVGSEGSTLTVRFGKLGTDGQTKPKDLGSPEAATKELNKLVAEKTKKGYVEVGTHGAATVAAAAPVTLVVPETPAAPTFPTMHVDGADRPVTWSCKSTTLRRRVEPGIHTVVAALVRGWAVTVATRIEAEALLARVEALPVGEMPAEPAGVVAAAGWLEGDTRPVTVVIGSILGARTSDTGPERAHSWAQGPAAAPLEEFRAREQWADAWIKTAFADVHATTADAPSTFLVASGDMGDAFLVLGAVGPKIAGLSYTRRTADLYGKKHDRGIAGVLLAHAAWDEGCFKRIDLSDAALASALAQVAGKVPRALLALAAGSDSRS